MNKNYVTLSIYLSRSLFIGGVFSLLVSTGYNTIIISSIIGMILGFIILMLFKKKGGLNKYVLFIISIIVLLINILSSTILVDSYLLLDTPSIVIIGSFLLLIVYGVFKLNSRIELLSFGFFIISFFIILVACSSLFLSIDFKNYFPIFNSSIGSIIKCCLIFCSSSLLPNLVVMNDNNSFKNIILGYFIGCIINILSLLLILGIYGYELGSIVRFPEYLVLKNVNIFNSIGNIENIIVMEWITCLIISSCSMVNYIYRNYGRKFIIIFLVIVCILINNVFIYNYSNVLLIKYYDYYVFIILIILSLVIKKEQGLK